MPITESMKKKLLYGLFLLFSGFLLYGETIFIYTVSEGTEATLKNSVPYLEDGVMEVLFDAGHIVFNASSTTPVIKKGLSSYKEPADFLTAKSGGASFLLEIAMHYSVADKKEIPEYADYRLYNVISGKLLKDGKIHIGKEGKNKKKSGEEKLTDMGRNMAHDVLGFL